METININMTPNCHEVETIHASQNDTSLRKWGIRPYDYDGNDATNQQDKATLVDIKGQTLKWNQLAKVTESFTSATSNGVTLSRVGDHLHIQGTATSSATFNSTVNCNEAINFPPAHKFLLSINPKNVNVLFGIQGYGLGYYQPTITVVRPSSETTVWQGVFQFRVGNGETVNTDLYLQAFDLTTMGIADKTDAEILQWFADYFPLSYYPFNSGSLIPFMGNGIKTVGKNLLDANIGIPYGGGSGMRWYESQGFMLMANKTYTFSASNTNGASVAVYIIDHATRTTLANGPLVTTYTPTQNVIVYLQAYRGSGIPSETEFQLEFGSTATSYEPYTSSLLNLPISTYFPTGMKRVGNYDELTPSKATTRIGAVTFNGSENWYFDSNNRLFQCAVANAIITDATTQYNVYTKNNRFDDKSWATRSEGSLGMYYGASYIFIKSTRFADVNALKTWLQSNPATVYYELATPIETAISPELDLTFNIDKGGTEELLPSSLMNGSVDLGSLTWRYESSVGAFMSTDLNTLVKKPSANGNVFNGWALNYASVSANNIYTKDKSIAINVAGNVFIRDTSFNGDATAFKNSLQGVYLWYETTDSTPTTTPLNATIKYPAETKDVYFTYQVSDFLSTIFKFYLVTKGIQIPCELEDDTLVADCTSEISNEPGFFDCKIKAENDLGQIFSSKFQLHIERSPQ